MRKTCEQCPKYENCKELCEEILNQIEKGDEKSDDSLDFDSPYKRDFSPIENFSDEDVSNNYSGSLNLGSWERKLLDEAIGFSIPSNKKKLKRQFNAFLKCNSITSIATRANAKKQDIQQKFQLIIKRVGSNLIKTLKKDGKISSQENLFDAVTTPYKFKQLVA